MKDNSLTQNQNNFKKSLTVRLLKLFAIAQQTGGDGEATKYLNGVESLLSNPAANKDALLSLASEIRQVSTLQVM